MPSQVKSSQFGFTWAAQVKFISVHFNLGLFGMRRIRPRLSMGLCLSQHVAKNIKNRAQTAALDRGVLIWPLSPWAVNENTPQRMFKRGLCSRVHAPFTCHRPRPCLLPASSTLPSWPRYRPARCVINCAVSTLRLHRASPPHTHTPRISSTSWSRAGGAVGCGHRVQASLKD